jgi:RecB family endonuclease NucS
MGWRTIVDLNRGGVSISEGIVQEWLYERPDLIQGEDLSPVIKWIGRQYKLPTGVADLIGVQENGNISLIEVKRLRITRADIWQVARYASGLERIFNRSYGDRDKKVDLILVGSGIGWEILNDARAAGVKVFSYSAIGEMGIYTGLTLEALWPEGKLHHG